LRGLGPHAFAPLGNRVAVPFLRGIRVLSSRELLLFIFHRRVHGALPLLRLVNRFFRGEPAIDDRQRRNAVVTLLQLIQHRNQLFVIGPGVGYLDTHDHAAVDISAELHVVARPVSTIRELHDAGLGVCGRGSGLIHFASTPLGRGLTLLLQLLALTQRRFDPLLVLLCSTLPRRNLPPVEFLPILLGQ